MFEREKQKNREAKFKTLNNIKYVEKRPTYKYLFEKCSMHYVKHKLQQYIFIA